jgi:hypothetical protein
MRVTQPNRRVSEIPAYTPVAGLARVRTDAGRLVHTVSEPAARLLDPRACHPARKFVPWIGPEAFTAGLHDASVSPSWGGVPDHRVRAKDWGVGGLRVVFRRD